VLSSGANQQIDPKAAQLLHQILQRVECNSVSDFILTWPRIGCFSSSGEGSPEKDHFLVAYVYVHYAVLECAICLWLAPTCKERTVLTCEDKYGIRDW